MTADRKSQIGPGEALRLLSSIVRKLEGINASLEHGSVSGTIASLKYELQTQEYHLRLEEESFSRRPCSTCGCKSKQFPYKNSRGEKVWECDCCGTETPRRTRSSQKQKDLSALFDSLISPPERIES